MLIRDCIRCMRFVYSQVHGVYILYTVVSGLLKKDNTFLSQRKKQHAHKQTI